jgi:hypothetical protein
VKVCLEIVMELLTHVAEVEFNHNYRMWLFMHPAYDTILTLYSKITLTTVGPSQEAERQTLKQPRSQQGRVSLRRAGWNILSFGSGTLCIEYIVQPSAAPTDLLLGMSAIGRTNASL